MFFLCGILIKTERLSLSGAKMAALSFTIQPSPFLYFFCGRLQLHQLKIYIGYTRNHSTFLRIYSWSPCSAEAFCPSTHSSLLKRHFATVVCLRLTVTAAEVRGDFHWTRTMHFLTPPPSKGRLFAFARLKSEIKTDPHNCCANTLHQSFNYKTEIPRQTVQIE